MHVYLGVLYSDVKAYDRVKKNLTYYGLYTDVITTARPDHSPDSCNDRLVVISGDLSRPMFGLSQSIYRSIRRDVTTVFHNGAMVNSLLPYASHYPPNVLGVAHVLQFCLSDNLPSTSTSTSKSKSSSASIELHYVSTVGVLGRDTTHHIVPQTSNMYDVIHHTSNINKHRTIVTNLRWTSQRESRL